MTALRDVLIRWRHDPLAFARECIGCTTLEDWQVQAFTALRTQRRIAIRSGHGVGKTSFNAMVILWWASTRDEAEVLVTAPVADQIHQFLFGEIRKWRDTMAAHSKIGAWLANQITIKDGEVVWANGNSCLARTARKDSPQSIAGGHAKNMLLLIDEASGVEEIIFETLIGVLSTPNAVQIMTGNPTKPQGSFYDAFTRQRDQFYTLRVSSADVPRACGHVDECARKYGVNSNAYRVRVLGEFPTGSDDMLIPLDLVEAAMGRDVEALPVRPLWGVDVGYRTDRSALCKRKADRDGDRRLRYAD